jgi:hypothetical protein
VVVLQQTFRELGVWAHEFARFLALIEFAYLRASERGKIDKKVGDRLPEMKKQRKKGALRTRRTTPSRVLKNRPQQFHWAF